MLIRGGIIQHVAKIDICHFARGDDMRHTDMTVCCTCSWSAAGARLLVERSECGETVGWLDGCWGWSALTTYSAP